ARRGVGGVGRIVWGVVGVMGLLVPSGVAVAVDDPNPEQWPTIQPPDTAGNQADPGPATWPAVEPPEGSSTGADPQPESWPAPQPS
ncbi:hypothetical protein, partial [Kribbella swartbergensis]